MSSPSLPSGATKALHAERAAALGSLWRNRELFRRLLLRDVQTAFRGSMLGLAWIVIIPLVLVAVYTFVFGAILKSTWAVEPRTPAEVPLIFFAGLGLFGFFMEVVTRAPHHIRESRTYVTKIIFPVEILAWVLVGSAFLKLCVNLALLLLFVLLLTGKLPATVLLLPVLLLPFVLFTTGLAWIFSAAGAFVRDLAHALQALGPVIMFVSPIFYSVSQIPEAFRPVFYANPLTFVLEGLRSILFFDQAFSLSAFGAYCAAAAIVFVAGFAFFERVRPGFADVV